METVCHNQLIFESLFSKEVIADFAGGRITPDVGGLLLRELDRRYRIAENAARCLHDPRDTHKVKHDLLTLVRQRFGIAQGYEDNNDAAALAPGPGSQDHGWQGSGECRRPDLPALTCPCPYPPHAPLPCPWGPWAWRSCPA